MSYYMKEENFEDKIVSIFEKMGYASIKGRKGEEDQDFRCPIMEGVFRDTLKLLNPKLPAPALEAAYERVRYLENASFKDKNAVFTEYLQCGVNVSYYDEGGKQRSALVKLADYENPDNNSFICARQWTYEEKVKRRPDILIFLNGLPVAIAELKYPTRGNEDVDTHAAFCQLKNYMVDIPTLFAYNCICVISDGETSKAGTITSDEVHFLEWKKKEAEEKIETCAIPKIETFWEGIFRKDRLLDIIKNFITFSESGPDRKKILARYNQYFCVKKAIERTKKAVKSDGKIGVVWHTQGSGKSLSMLFYAHLLQETLESPTIVVITDRNDLDGQLFSQFAKCAGFLRQTPVHAESRAHLKKFLDGRKANGIIFTTLQKFEESDTPLSKRRNIVVIADEAHRSHYGLVERMNRKTGRIGRGLERVLRDSLPNASYIGFTGTPIELGKKDTYIVFGPLIDVYDMMQSVEDGATCKVCYEGRGMKLSLRPEFLSRIDEVYKRMLEEGASPEAIQKSKEHLAQMASILGSKEAIDTLSSDMISHYENYRENITGGKAMIIAQSRPIAMKLYNKIIELRPEWKKEGKIAVIMTESNKDPEGWRQVTGNKSDRDALVLKFKDDKSPLKIVIVVDMLLTGFDLPSLSTMYIYKMMDGHNLMQAIARVNRVFPGKAGGLIVDYIGIMSELEKALKVYTKRDSGSRQKMDIEQDALPEFRKNLDRCREIFASFDYSQFFTGDDAARFDMTVDAQNYIIAPRRLKERDDFRKSAKLMKDALSLCSQIVESNERNEAAFFENVRAGVEHHLLKIGPYTLGDINNRIKELIQLCIKSDGVNADISSSSSKTPIFDLDFLDKLKTSKRRDLAAELLARIIAGKVWLGFGGNSVLYKKFSEMLQAVMNKYRNAILTSEQVIQALIELAHNLIEEANKGEELGLTDEEYGFYSVLVKPKGILALYNVEELKKMTAELTRIFHNNRTVDWQNRDEVQAAMRQYVRRLLRKYNYPDKEQKGVIELFIEQCKQAEEACEAA